MRIFSTALRTSCLAASGSNAWQFEGVPADEIVLAVRTWEADLIVIGTRGRNRVAEFLLGSVADAVIRRAPCPVLTVGHEPVVRTGAGEATAYQVV